MNVVRHEGRPPQRIVVSLTPEEAKDLAGALTWLPTIHHSSVLIDVLHRGLLAALDVKP